MSTATASWPVDTLVQSLGRAGWGDLDGGPNKGARTVLEGLVKLLPHGSATGHTTAPQLAEATGLTERWVRHCLHLLEAAGIILWRRGGVRGARAIPSTITIIKRRLADMIRAARKLTDRATRRQARRDDLAARVESHGVRTFWAPRRTSPTGSEYRPSLLKEVTAPTAGAGTTNQPTTGADMLPHALREFIGPRADYLTADQERRILRAEERAGQKYPGLSNGDARQRTWHLRRDVEAILTDQQEPSIAPDDGAPLDWNRCEICDRTRTSCENIPARISAHTFTPKKLRSR